MIRQSIPRRVWRYPMATVDGLPILSPRQRYLITQSMDRWDRRYRPGETVTVQLADLKLTVN